MSDKFVVCDVGATIIRLEEVPDDVIVEMARSLGVAALKDKDKVIVVGRMGGSAAEGGWESQTSYDDDDDDDDSGDGSGGSFLTGLYKLLKRKG